MARGTISALVIISIYMRRRAHTKLCTPGQNPSDPTPSTGRAVVDTRRLPVEGPWRANVTPYSCKN